jgi:hypothetical protein
MKCSHCGDKPTNRSILFAFKDGKIIYACTKHASAVKKDAVTDWFRVGKWIRAK